jgi:hypothetical protein
MIAADKEKARTASENTHRAARYAFGGKIKGGESTVVADSP